MLGLVLKSILFKIISLIFTVLEYLASFVGLTPTKGPINENNEVEIRKVLWRYKGTLLGFSLPSNFITWPGGFCKRSDILKDNITLYCTTDTQAWFAETPAHINIYSSDIDPFLYLAQYKLATRFHVVSLETFIALADDVGEPEVPVILLSSHGRCGSTLLTQVFESVPGAVTLAEPDALTSIMEFRGKSKAQLKSLVAAILKLLCRTMDSQDVSFFCIKTRSLSVVLVDIIAEELPAVVHLFMYRDCVPSLISMERTFSKNSGMMRYWFMFVNTRLGKWITKKTTKLSDESTLMEIMMDRYSFVSTVQFMAGAPYGIWIMMWIIACGEYLRLRKAGIKIKAIRYEDLLSDTERAVENLSTYTGIKLDASYIKKNVMKKDSQRGTILSQDRNKSTEKFGIDEKSLTVLQMKCKTFDLPDVDPGTTTFLEGTMQ